jgi:class 3 adenylate cyclase
LGIEVRAGLHTGECDLLQEDRVGGVTVEIGRRVRDHAAVREVWVSHTVKDLIAGSGISFEDRGSHSFKEMPGSWRLFKVKCESC